MLVKRIKEKYVPGTRVKLHSMRNESQMPYGLEGTVQFVDDAGQIHVKWDDGSNLALIYGEDEFEVVCFISKG